MPVEEAAQPVADESGQPAAGSEGNGAAEAGGKPDAPAGAPLFQPPAASPSVERSCRPGSRGVRNRCHHLAAPDAAGSDVPGPPPGARVRSDALQPGASRSTWTGLSFSASCEPAAKTAAGRRRAARFMRSWASSRSWASERMNGRQCSRSRAGRRSPTAPSRLRATTGQSASRALVTGLQAAKPALQRRVLADSRIDIYPGGRSDIASGQIDVRVLVVHPLSRGGERAGQRLVAALRPRSLLPAGRRLRAHVWAGRRRVGARSAPRSSDTRRQAASRSVQSATSCSCRPSCSRDRSSP